MNRPEIADHLRHLPDHLVEIAVLANPPLTVSCTRPDVVVIVLAGFNDVTRSQMLFRFPTDGPFSGFLKVAGHVQPHRSRKRSREPFDRNVCAA